MHTTMPVGQARTVDIVEVGGCGAISAEVARCGGTAKRFGLSISPTHDLADGCGFDPLLEMCMALKKGGTMWMHVDSKSWTPSGHTGVTLLTENISPEGWLLIFLVSTGTL